MKNPYNIMQANHVGSYYAWEAGVKLDEAEAEITKAIAELTRSSSDYIYDAVCLLREKRKEVRTALDNTERMEKELLELWENHHPVRPK